MKRSFELSMTLCDALVLVLMLLKSSKVSVQAVESYREIHLTARNGSISSPSYPKIYPTNLQWTWIIQSSQYKVILEIQEMDLYRCYLVDPTYEDCQKYDHVTISNYGMYCNGIKPEKVISFVPWTGEIHITFRSLNSRKQCRGNGFKAYYWLVMETPTTRPRTLAPTHSTVKHNTVDDGKEALKLTLPIAFGIIVVAIFLIVLTVWCWRKKSNNRQSSSANRNARAIEARNRLLGLEIERHPDQAERQARDDPIRYSDIVYRDDIVNAGVPLNCGPPPSYDEICRDADNLNRSHILECPPSYETAMSESTAHSPERLNQASRGVVMSDVHNNIIIDAQGDASPRILHQLRPNISSEDGSTERSEVFV